MDTVELHPGCVQKKREDDEVEDSRSTRKAQVNNKAREGRGEQWQSKGHQQEAGTAAGALHWKSWNSSSRA
eukprot:7630386-Pyramimonas_sp.AAC.1